MSDTTFATPKAGIGYPVYPQYEEPKKVCGNCKHWAFVFVANHRQCKGVGQHGNQNTLLPFAPDGFFTPKGFSCPLWEAKESEGGET